MCAWKKQVQESAVALFSKTKEKAAKESDDIKEAIDKQFTKMAYYGIERMTEHLENEDFTVNKKRVRPYYWDLCINGTYPKPKITTRNAEHDISLFAQKHDDLSL